MRLPLSGSESFSRDSTTPYLDTASVALLPHEARLAVGDWLDRIAREGTRWFDEATEEHVTFPAREASARLLHADVGDVVVGSSATELLASLAWAVAPVSGTTVVGSAMAFPSTTQPWARVTRATGATLRLTGSPGGPLVHGDVERVIDRTTSIVCVSDVEYQTGQRHDLATIVDKAHAVGALVVVDASQSLGVLRHDAVATGVDAIVSSGYKWLCGPFGAAVMYVAPQLREHLDPGVVGFRSALNMWQLNSGRAVYPETATRFEAGSFFYGASLGLSSSLRLLDRLGWERIEAHATVLARRLAQALRDLGAEVWPRESEPASGIVAARFPWEKHGSVGQALREAGVVFSRRGGRLRFSLHVYNDTQDVDRVTALARLALA